MTTKGPHRNGEIRQETLASFREASSDEVFFERVRERAAFEAEGPTAACGEMSRTIECAGGEFEEDEERVVREHLAECSQCLGAYVAARVPAVPDEALAREVLGRCREAVRAAVRRRWHWAYDSAQAFRAAVARVAPTLDLAVESLWPRTPRGQIDWVGVLLQGAVARAYEADSEPGSAALGQAVYVHQGQLSSVEFFDVTVAYAWRKDGKLHVAGRLDEAVCPVPPNAGCECAWVASNQALCLQLEESEGLDRDTGTFSFAFPAEADPDGEFRLVLLLDEPPSPRT